MDANNNNNDKDSGNQSDLKTNVDDLSSSWEEENQFLKDNVIRLTKELLTLQNESNGTKIFSRFNEKDIENLNLIEIPPWMLDGAIISPLFLSYDNRIKELSSFIEQQGSYLDKLTKSVQSLTLENHQMRERSSPYKVMTSTKMEGQGEGRGEGHDGDKQRSKDRDRSTSERNGKQLYEINEDKLLLEEQSELLVNELDHANQCISSRDKCISELTEELHSKLDSMKSLSVKNERLVDEKRVIEQHLHETIEKSAQYRNLTDDLTKKLKRIELSQSKIVMGANVNKTEKEELQQRNDELQDEMIQLSTTCVQELQQDLARASSSYEAVNVEVLAKTKELRIVRKQMDALERSLSKYKMQHDFIQSDEAAGNIRNTNHANMTNIREIEMERDILNAKVASLEKEVDTLNEQNLRLVDAIGIGKSLKNTKAQHDLEVEQRDSSLMELRLKSSELKYKLGGLERKLCSALKEKAKLEDLLRDERKSNKLEELQQSLQKTDETLQIERRERKKAIDDAIKAERDKMTNSDMMRSIEQVTKNGEVTNAHEWADVVKQQNTIDALKSETNSRMIASEEVLRKTKEDAKKCNTRLQERILELERKIEEKEITIEETARSLSEARSSIIKLSAEYSEAKVDTNNKLEAISANSKKFYQRHELKFRKSVAESSSLAEENGRLRGREVQCKALNVELVCSRSKLSSLGKQLSRSIREQKRLLEREREMKTEIHRLRQ